MGVTFRDLARQAGIEAEVLTLYSTAFPRDERREPDEMLRILKADPAFHCRVGLDAATGALLSFVSYWDFGKFHYIEHLAVEPGMRGQGVGSATIRDFIANVAARIVLEVEPPVDTTTRKRVDFYRTLGFTLWSGFGYIQPPYSPASSPVELCLMTYGPFTLAGLPDASATIAARVYHRYYNPTPRL